MSEHTEFEKNVRAAIEKYGMFRAARRPLIALSGGADSVALLHFLHAAREELGVNCAAVHVDHRIRRNSARDADFCADLCRRLGVRLQIITADVPSLSREWKCGLEEAGRRVRYSAYERVCDELGCDCVCTAHHADDNLETMIFNLLRGSGARGMAGIPPVRGNIVRPLILCTRAQIEEYLAACGLDFVEDETNASDDYSRNFIRHNVLPPMRALGGDAAEAASRTAGFLRADDEYLTALAREALDAAATDGGWSATALAALPDPVLTRALSIAAAGQINLEEAVRAIRLGRDLRVSVGNATALIVYRGAVRFTRDEREDPPEFCVECELEKPIRAENGEWEFLLTRTPPRADAAADRSSNIYKKSIYAALDFDKIIGGPYIRTRRPGDRVRAGGMDRTVKNLLQEAGVPEVERAGLPFLCDGRGIIWIPGAALRDGMEPGPGGRAVYAVFTKS